MAKSRQALAKWRGRAGAMVYSVRNGQQIISAAPEKMTNPRTAAQAAQRMKLAPAGAFYRTMEGLVNLGLISHTFQGKKYGEENRRRFMQLAMLNNQGPFVPKDTLTLVPGDYQISEGSLPSFTGRVVCDDDTAGASTENLQVLPVGTEITAENVQEFANALGCEVGDQISVLYFQYLGGAYVPTVERMIVEAGHTLGVDVLPNYGVDHDYCFYVQDETLAAGTNQWGTAVLYVDGQAGAVIISQKQTDGSYLRSTEFIHINDELRQKYYSPEAYDAALASYMNASNENNNASPYYNNLSFSQAFNGKIFCSPMKAENNLTGQIDTIYVFWAQLANGNNVIFTDNGEADGNLVWLYNGTPTSPRYDGVYAFNHYQLDNLTTSKNWAGIYMWDEEYYTQWTSGQRAVRPMGTEGAEWEHPVIDKLRTKFGSNHHVEISQLIIETTAGNLSDTLVAVDEDGSVALFATLEGTSVNIIKGSIENGFVQSAQIGLTVNDGDTIMVNGEEYAEEDIVISTTIEELIGLPSMIDL